MALPEQKFYELLDLAEKRWPNVTENMLFQWGEEGLLKISTHSRLLLLHSHENSIPFTGDVALDPSALFRLKVYQADNLYLITEQNGPVLYRQKSENSLPIHIDRDSLVVMTDEVARMETDYPELLVKHPGGRLKKGKNVAERNILDATAKEEITDIHIIGALLDAVMSGEKFKSETKLRDYIAKKFKGFQGCAESTLAKRFKKAKEKLLE